MQKQRMSMDDKNKKLQKKLEEILPESIKDEGNKNYSNKEKLSSTNRWNVSH